MQVIYYVFFIFSFFFLLYKKRDFIVYLPLFYLIYETSFNYFPTLTFITYVRPIVFSVLLIFYLNKISINAITKPFFIFWGYTILLVFFSSEIFYSFRGYTQVFISMMCFVLSFLYFNNRIKLDSLNKTAFAVLVFSVFSSLIGYVFGIGTVLEYTASNNPETIGLLRSFGMYSAAVIIGILPLVISSFRRPFWRWMVYAFAITSYIFILLNVRRTAIGIPIVGLLTYAWFIPQKSRFISGVIFGGLILLLLSPFYSDIFIGRFTVREEKGRFDEDFYKTEGRYMENLEIFSEAFSFEDPLRSFFGTNIYASGRKGKELSRMYHSDPANLLAGTGIVGFTLYIYLLIRLFKYGSFFKSPKSSQYKLYKATYYSLLFILLFVSLNGSLQVVTLGSILFLFLGALLSLMYHGKVVKPETIITKNGLPQYSYKQ